jgi:rhodanese-related sulfurtransferase
MQLAELRADVPDLIHQNPPVVAVCKTDRRSSLPAPQLQQAGLSDPSVLRRRMDQWRLLGLPTNREAREGS